MKLRGKYFSQGGATASSIGILAIVLGYAGSAAAVTCKELLTIVTQQAKLEATVPHLADSHFSSWVNGLLGNAQSQQPSPTEIPAAFASWVGAASAKGANVSQFACLSTSDQASPLLGLLQNAVETPHAEDKNFVLVGRDQILRFLSYIDIEIANLERGHNRTRTILAAGSFLAPVLIYFGVSEMNYSFFETHADLSGWTAEIREQLRSDESAPVAVTAPTAPTSRWRRLFGLGQAPPRSRDSQLRTMLQLSGIEAPDISVSSPLRLTGIMAKDAENRFGFLLVEGALGPKPVLLTHVGPNQRETK